MCIGVWDPSQPLRHPQTLSLPLEEGPWQFQGWSSASMEASGGHSPPIPTSPVCLPHPPGAPCCCHTHRLRPGPRCSLHAADVCRLDPVPGHGWHFPRAKSALPTCWGARDALHSGSFSDHLVPLPASHSLRAHRAGTAGTGEPPPSGAELSVRAWAPAPSAGCC